MSNSQWSLRITLATIYLVLFFLSVAGYTPTLARTISVEFPMPTSSIMCYQTTHNRELQFFSSTSNRDKLDGAIAKASDENLRVPQRIFRSVKRFVTGIPCAALSISGNLVVHVGMGVELDTSPDESTPTTKVDTRTQLQIGELQKSITQLM